MSNDDKNFKELSKGKKTFRIVTGVLAVALIAAALFFAKGGNLSSFLNFNQKGNGNNRSSINNSEATEVDNKDDADSSIESTIAEADPLEEVYKASWSDMIFAMEDKIYRLPFAYQDICDEWYFNGDYGFDDSFLTEPGEGRYCSIDLDSGIYDMDLMVGTINSSASTRPITKNNIWAIDMSIETCESYPSLLLPKGITWGSSLDEIKTAYGEPQEGPDYEKDSGYCTIEYSLDYEYYMTLIIYDEGGLRAVTLENRSVLK